MMVFSDFSHALIDEDESVLIQYVFVCLHISCGFFLGRNALVR